MKRKISFWYVIIFMVIFTLAIVILGPVFWWNSKKESPLNVWIIDKTVPDQTYREHVGLMWLLNHNKVKNEKTGEYFKYNSDYFGFFPQEQGTYQTKEAPTAYEGPQLIYITDTYGVYTEDDYKAEGINTNPNLIYGGVSDQDIFAIKNNLGGGNTLIGEFNIASDPTSTANKIELENLFGVEFIGWRGVYFGKLDRGVDVPSRIVEQYKSNEQKSWTFTGGGYVLISDEGKIAVLEEGSHIKKNGLKVKINEAYQGEFKIDKAIAYHYWFEFVTPKLGKETIANYEMNVTEEGKKLMEDLGLPVSFPAITRYSNNLYTGYYFAGDFTDIPQDYGLWKYAGIEKLNKFTSSFNKGSLDYFYWNCYAPVMNKIIKDVKEKASDTQRTEQEHPDTVNVKTVGSGFQILKNNTWTDIFIKGVNIGAALPGKWFTEFPTDEQTYYNWFEQIGRMNSNTIRIYTLLPPAFYNALKYYNDTHPDNILWLLQEIWPDENPEGLNYLNKDYVDRYNQEIKNVIDAVHGYAKIDVRAGRAYGMYSADVSSYIMGYLVGRELEPEEVITTNQLNSDFSYTGMFLSSAKGASATEAWLAMNCDYVLQYESTTYGWQHPTAIVSWPTLDVAEHDTEWNEQGLKSLEYNDKVSVDINKIDTTDKLLAGFFGAYHIYPNYPDFMNNESGYADYTDEEGVLRYGGYLQQFMKNHTKYPALVAEFGLATGMGNAHTNPDGYHHGGLTEEEQGKGIVRMMKAIERENYAGGLIFEWMDEWAKKTWITEPYMIPYDRHVFWHNAIDPEQNYGILAMETNEPTNSAYSIKGTDEIKEVALKQDPTYLYIEVTLEKTIDFTTKHLYLGLDTYDREKGEYKFNPTLNTTAPFGLEFLLDFTGINSSKLLVQPGYNISKGNYASYTSHDGVFEEISQQINSERISKDGTKTEVSYQNGSELTYGEFTENSYYQWYIDGNKIVIRLPWNRLNFSDPSGLTVLWDEKANQNPIRDEIGTAITDGIMISTQLVEVATGNTLDILNSETPYQWEAWTEFDYIDRLKKSYYIIQDYFNELN